MMGVANKLLLTLAALEHRKRLGRCQWLRMGYVTPAEPVCRYVSSGPCKTESATARGHALNTENHSQTAGFIWGVADLLRGDLKQSQYGRVILPFTLLRRLECVLEPTKQAVREAYQQHKDKPVGVQDKLLRQAAEQPFYNFSGLTLGTLSETQTAEDLKSYIQAFSVDAAEIFEYFNFEDFIDQLNASNRRIWTPSTRLTRSARRR